MSPPRRLAPLLLFAVALAFLACKKDPSTTGADAKRATGLYARGYNALVGEPRRLIRGYFSQFPADKPPAITQPPSLSASDSFVTQRIDEARKAFDEARDAAPSTLASFAPAAAAALSAMESTLAIYNKAAAYYAAESYKDDKGEQANKLHGELGKATHELDQKLDALAAEIEKVEDAQAVDEIAKYAGDKDYSYWFRYYTHEAKQVVIALDRGGPPTALVAAIDKLSATSEQFAAFVTKKGNALSSSFTSYVSAVEGMRAEIAKLRRLASGEHADAELEQAVSAVYSAYNRLVDIGNTLYQVEGVDNLKDK